MQQETTIINGEELFGDFLKVPESQNSEESFEKYWEWPDRLGNGFMYVTDFRPGLRLTIGDYQLRENPTINFEVTRLPSIVLSFGVSGSIWFELRHGQAKKNIYILNSGQSHISYFSEWRGIVKYPASIPIRVVTINVDAIFLNKIMGDQHGSIPAYMRNILEETSENHYYQSNNTTPAMNVAIHQILNCPYRGLLKRMYLESKTLELITHKLAQVVSSKCGLRNPSPLRPADIERIYEAKDILISNMQNPPSLFDLARQVGLNDTKLKRGFRQVYGTSVFRYLRDYRFEYARRLLEERRINVSEVAFAVGYSRLDYFISSFKARFGTTPGVYSRGRTFV